MKTPLSVLSCAATIGIACVVCGTVAWADDDLVQPWRKLPKVKLNPQHFDQAQQEVQSEEEQKLTKPKKAPTYKKSTLSKEQADDFLDLRRETALNRKKASVDLKEANEEWGKKLTSKIKAGRDRDSSQEELDKLEDDWTNAKKSGVREGTGDKRELKYKAQKIIHDNGPEKEYEEAEQKETESRARVMKAQAELAEANAELADIPRRKLVTQRTNYLANKAARQQANPLNIQTGPSGIYTAAPRGGAAAAPTQAYGAAPMPSGGGNYTPAPARGAQ